jgi:4-aminobutyrate aminotransferase/(S)-3-amino-2-methylpropionate transaminase
MTARDDVRKLHAARFVEHFVGQDERNPVAIAAALATLKTMKEQNLNDRARHIGEILTKHLRDLQERCGIAGDVRGRGAMIALEFVTPGTKDPNPEALKAIVRECNQHGLIALTCGEFANVLRLLPPLVISDDQLDDGLNVLSSAILNVS